MKYIFDFDDVLFNNTAQFKKHMYLCLEDAGVPNDVALKYYKEVREKGFSIKNFVSTILIREKINEIDEEKLYEKIMAGSKNFINTELIELVKKLGKSNCYIVTHGKEEYQLDKINRTDIASLFFDIITVQDSKKESIEKICSKYKDEQIIFIDDKEKRLLDINFIKCPNIKTILYTGQSAEKLMKEIEE